MNKVYLTKQFIYLKDEKLENNEDNLQKLNLRDFDVILSLEYFNLIEKSYFFNNSFSYRYNNVLIFKIINEEYTHLKKYFRNYTNVLEFLKISENDEMIYCLDKYVIYFKFVMNQIVEIEKIDVEFENIKYLDIGQIKVITDEYLIRQIFENEINYKKYKLNIDNYFFKYYNILTIFILILISILNYFNYFYFNKNEVNIVSENNDKINEYSKKLTNLIDNVEYEKNIQKNIKSIKNDNLEITNNIKVFEMLIKIYDSLGVEYKNISYSENILKVIIKIDSYNKYKILHNYLNKYYNITKIELKNIIENNKEYIEYTFNMKIDENKN